MIFIDLFAVVSPRTQDIVLPMVGFVIGLLVGMSGSGAGSLISPVLYLLGIPVGSAITVSMTASLITKPIGALRLRKLVDRTVLKWVAIPGFLSGALGAVLAKRIPDKTLLIFLSATLLISSFSMIFRLVFHEPKHTINSPLPFYVLLGAFSGFLVGITSIGSGAVLIAGLFWISPGLFKNSEHLVATDLACATFMLIIPVAIHIAYGSFQITLILLTALGLLPGIILGTQLLGFEHARKISRVLIISTVTISAIRMLTAAI
jgi:uncharacterized membrane protein YfcA